MVAINVEHLIDVTCERSRLPFDLHIVYDVFDASPLWSTVPLGSCNCSVDSSGSGASLWIGDPSKMLVPLLLRGNE